MIISVIISAIVTVIATILSTIQEIMLNLAAGSLRFVKRPTPDPRDATIKKPLALLSGFGLRSSRSWVGGLDCGLGLTVKRFGSRVHFLLPG